MIEKKTKLLEERYKTSEIRLSHAIRKEFGFTVGMLKGALAKERKK